MFNKKIIAEALGAKVIDVTVKEKCIIIEYTHKDGNGVKTYTQPQLTSIMRKVQ